MLTGLVFITVTTVNVIKIVFEFHMSGAPSGEIGYSPHKVFIKTVFSVCKGHNAFLRFFETRKAAYSQASGFQALSY